MTAMSDPEFSKIAEVAREIFTSMCAAQPGSVMDEAAVARAAAAALKAAEVYCGQERELRERLTKKAAS